MAHRKTSKRFKPLRQYFGFHLTEMLLAHDRNSLGATTNGGDDGNLASVGDGAREPTRIPDVFVTDENIDVLPHVPLFGCDAIPKARIDYPERRQRLGQSLR